MAQGSSKWGTALLLAFCVAGIYTAYLTQGVSAWWRQWAVGA